MPEVITVNKLTKRYGQLMAVNDVSFTVNKGEIFGLLGENGAGKTTTLEIIEGLRRPSSGSVKVLGHDSTKEIDQIKGKIGVQLQSSAYYNYLSLKEMLELFGSFYGQDVEALKLLESVNLVEKQNAYVSQLSGGQRQRFSIVASLVNDPEIVFLDEPTTGLDPLARRNLWELILDIKRRGKTLVLTTHYMEEAELLCDRIGLMDNGRIVALEETARLIDKASKPYKIHFESAKVLAKSAEGTISRHGQLKPFAARKNTYDLLLSSSDNLNAALDEVRSLQPKSLSVTKARLEDVFLELTGKTIEEEGEDA